MEVVHEDITFKFSFCIFFVKRTSSGLGHNFILRFFFLSFGLIRTLVFWTTKFRIILFYFLKLVI